MSVENIKLTLPLGLAGTSYVVVATHDDKTDFVKDIIPNGDEGIATGDIVFAASSHDATMIDEYYEAERICKLCEGITDKMQFNILQCEWTQHIDVVRPAHN